MKKITLRSLFFFSVWFSMFSIVGCGDEVKNLVTVQMKNSSSTEVHMWTSGEGIDPSNKLVSGQSRTTSFNFSSLVDDEVYNINVSVGQNGATIASQVFVMSINKLSLKVSYSGGSIVKID